MAKSKIVDPTAPPSMIKDVLAKRKEHRITIVAAGVAFFAFISLVPAIAAAVSITSLVADPELLRTEAAAALEAAPEETSMFLLAQIDGIIDNSGAAGVAAAIGIAASVFSASGAMGHMMEGLNAVNDRQETRSFIVKRGTAVLLMLGALVVVAAMVFAMSIVPALVSNFVDSSVLSTVINVGRFFALGAIVVAGLSILYRFGPVNDATRSNELVPGGKTKLFTVGGLVGTILILLFSAGYAWVTANLGGAGAAYGTLATIIVVLLWLQYLALGVLLGAEVDAYTRRKKVWDARTNAGLPAVRPEEPIEAAA